MSIEMDNPKTLLEKADAAANLVEQMMLAHTVRDEKKFKEAHAKASSLLFELTRELDEADADDEISLDDDEITFEPL